MKKCLVWLLAVMMLLTACGDAVPGDQSQPETSQDEVYTGETRYTLVSVGKPYTTSSQPEERYPDVFGMQVTDGQKTPDEGVHYTDTRMIGYTQSTNYIIDLGEEDGKRISAVSVRCLDFYSDGVRIAASARISGSVDGKKYKSIGTAPFMATGDQTVSTATVKLKEVTDYRYIKVFVSIMSGSHFYFLDEIEVFACVPEEEKTNTVELSYKEDNTDKNAWKALSTGNAAKPSYTKNIAAGAQYTINDCEFDERAPKQDEYLTDGAHTGRLFGEDVWVGIKGVEGKSPNISVGLTASRKDIFAFKVHALGDVLDVTYPDYIDVYGSKGGEYTFLGRMYAPSESDNYAYTLILPEYVELKLVRFEFPQGEGNYWIEEVEVYAGSDEEFNSQLYPPLDFEEVTEEVYWDESEPDYGETVNLIQGVIQQVANSTYMSADEPRSQKPSSSDFPYLTDGKRATDLYCYSGQWFFSPGGGALDFIYDMGALSSVQKLNVSLLEQEDWGIARPTHITLYLSENGDDWYRVAQYDRPGDQVFNKSATRVEFPFELDTAYKARYVMFRIESAVLFVDELECFGTKEITSSTVSLADSGIKSMNYYINEESQQFATVENTGFNSEEIIITYPNDTTPEMLLPMLAYLDEEGNIKDTFMDGVLLCYRGTLPSGQLGHTGTRMADWEVMRDSSFDDITGFDVIDAMVGDIKSQLNKSDYTVKVYISIPLIYDTITDFGDVDGDGVIETLATPEDRKKVMDWFITTSMNEFENRQYKNIELGGFYWLSESVVWEKDDSHIITEVGEIVHSYNTKFFWVPYYVAHRYILGQEMNFDLVCMQPNYVFSLEYPYYRVTHTPELAARYNMCVEIEHSYQCLSDPVFARRYMLYLYYGAVTGYMDAVHVYYDDVENLGMMGLSDSPLCRMQYDATYQFAKGTLDVTPDKKDDAKLTTAAETILYGDLNEEDALSLFTLASMPENGTVSLNTDGSFVYYPNKGFTGTDKFTYTYNNFLGESEECVVEITVG